MQNVGELSAPFEVKNWVKQSCVMALTLFSMMFSAMFMDAFQDSDTCFPIRYRFDGNIFNLRRVKAKTKVQTDVLDELLYADDMDKNARSEAKCKEPRTNSHNHVISMISQSAQEVGHQQHLENHTMNQQPSL